MLYRNWAAVRSIRRTATDLQLSVMIRFGVFSLVVGFAAVHVFSSFFFDTILISRPQTRSRDFAKQFAGRSGVEYFPSDR
jgi:hypothetical protein